MSPDNWYSNPQVKRLIDGLSNLKGGFPHLGSLMAAEPCDFTGLTMFRGDTNEFVVGVRRFGDDGGLQIMWSSGTTPVDALLNVDRAIQGGKWRVDKPKKVVEPKTAVKKN